MQLDMLSIKIKPFFFLMDNFETNTANEAQT
jgi:hypothetical protein